MRFHLVSHFPRLVTWESIKTESHRQTYRHYVDLCIDIRCTPSRFGIPAITVHHKTDYKKCHIEIDVELTSNVIFILFYIFY